MAWEQPGEEPEDGEELDGKRAISEVAQHWHLEHLQEPHVWHRVVPLGEGPEVPELPEHPARQPGQVEADGHAPFAPLYETYDRGPARQVVNGVEHKGRKAPDEPEEV